MGLPTIYLGTFFTLFVFAKGKVQEELKGWEKQKQTKTKQQNNKNKTKQQKLNRKQIEKLINCKRWERNKKKKIKIKE